MFGGAAGIIFPMIDAATRDTYLTVANLLLQQVPLEQIGQVVGLAPSTISELKAVPEFQEIFRRQAAEFHQANKEIDEGWDFLEKQALTGLVENLQYNKNPDFLLRTAVMANKAQRRTRAVQNTAIPAGDAGARVVIHLQPQFIAKLQMVNKQTAENLNGANSAKIIDATPVENSKIPQKQVNMLLPNQVEDLLFPAQTKNETLQEMVEAVFVDDGKSGSG
jgi:hypothetical protein